MTLLTACQNVARHPNVGQPVPTAVMAATGQFESELVGLLPQCVRAIIDHHDWRLLTTLHTLTGDGATTSFSLPADYDRMPLKAAVFSTATQLPFEAVDDLDEWLRRDLMSFSSTQGSWIVLGGYLQIKHPTMPVGTDAKFYYVSNAVVAPAAGSNKAAFTLDTDSFRLPEILLELELIWRWRAAKGLDYAEDMENAQLALAGRAAKDKGSRVFHVGRARLPDDVRLAYPGTISG